MKVLSIRNIIIVALVVVVAILAFDIYTTIINYHIIIYLTLVTLPITSLAKQGVSLPFLLFIQFFWAALSVWVVSYFPLFNFIDLSCSAAYTLVDVVVW
jgi:hypothetical protein